MFTLIFESYYSYFNQFVKLYKLIHRLQNVLLQENDRLVWTVTNIIHTKLIWKIQLVLLLRILQLMMNMMDPLLLWTVSMMKWRLDWLLYKFPKTHFPCSVWKPRNCFLRRGYKTSHFALRYTQFYLICIFFVDTLFDLCIFLWW